MSLQDMELYASSSNWKEAIIWNCTVQPFRPHWLPIYYGLSKSIQQNPAICIPIILIGILFDCDRATISRLFQTIIYWFFDKNITFNFTKRWISRANTQICWINKLSTHSKILSHFCQKLYTVKPYKAVYWWFWRIQIVDKIRALFII